MFIFDTKCGLYSCSVIEYEQMCGVSIILIISERPVYCNCTS